MNVLIIGGAGFVGQYLIRHLQESYPWKISVTKMTNEVIDCTDIDIYDLDILNKGDTKEILAKTQPDYIFHLAAQSSVAASWKNPGLTIDINVKGSVILLDTIRELGLSPRILLIGSGEEYGYIREDEVPIVEDNVLRPGNIYAATKACQNMIGTIYSKAYQMDIIMVRAFNHIGPGQAPIFVVSDFCKQVAEIEKGLRPPQINVGNLQSKRDFTDVRDVVRAYGLLIQHGLKGETYNIGQGKCIEIASILEDILTLSPHDIKINIDEAKFRPIDVPIIEADIQKITGQIDWKASIPIKQTLEETLNYWRSQL